MRKFVELVRSNIVVQAIVSILLGLFLFIWPQTTVIMLVNLLAAAIALSGLASLVSYFRKRKKNDTSSTVLVSGIFLLVIALLVFAFSEAVASIFAVVLGILLIISGIINALRSFEMRAFGRHMWIIGLIVSLIIAIGGIVILVNPFDTTVTFVLVVGAVLVAKGVTDLCLEFAFSRGHKE